MNYPKTVYDLTKEELAELCETYYAQLIETGDADEIMGEDATAADIPDEVVIEHYKGILFYQDDFACNGNKEE